MKNTPELIYRLNYVKLNFNKSVRKIAEKKRNFENLFLLTKTKVT